MPRTQLATKTANAANQRLTGLSERARQTNSARAVRRPASPSNDRWATEVCLTRSAQDHSNVSPAKAVRVNEGGPDSSGSSDVGNVVEIAPRINDLVVD